MTFLNSFSGCLVFQTHPTISFESKVLETTCLCQYDQTIKKLLYLNLFALRKDSSSCVLKHMKTYFHGPPRDFWIKIHVRIVQIKYPWLSIIVSGNYLPRAISRVSPQATRVISIARGRSDAPLPPWMLGMLERRAHISSSVLIQTLVMKKFYIHFVSIVAIYFTTKMSFFVWILIQISIEEIKPANIRREIYSRILDRLPKVAHSPGNFRKRAACWAFLNAGVMSEEHLGVKFENWNSCGGPATTVFKIRVLQHFFVILIRHVV